MAQLNIVIDMAKKKLRHIVPAPSINKLKIPLRSLIANVPGYVLSSC